MIDTLIGAPIHRKYETRPEFQQKHLPHKNYDTPRIALIKPRNTTPSAPPEGVDF